MLQTILRNGTACLQTCVPKNPVSAFGQIIRLNPLGRFRACRRDAGGGIRGRRTDLCYTNTTDEGRRNLLAPVGWAWGHY